MGASKTKELGGLPVTKRLGDYQRIFGDGHDGLMNITSNLTLTTTLDGEEAVIECEDFYLASGVTLTVSNRCRGLVIKSRGNVVINGTINMTQKGSYGYGLITPLLNDGTNPGGSSVTPSGSWTTAANASALFGTRTYSTTYGAYYTFTFTGRRGGVVFTQDTVNDGMVISIDGIKMANVGVGTQAFKRIWLSPLLSAGTHTLRVEKATNDATPIYIEGWAIPPYRQNPASYLYTYLGAPTPQSPPAGSILTLERYNSMMNINYIGEHNYLGGGAGGAASVNGSAGASYQTGGGGGGGVGHVGGQPGSNGSAFGGGGGGGGGAGTANGSASGSSGGVAGKGGQGASTTNNGTSSNGGGGGGAGCPAGGGGNGAGGNNGGVGGTGTGGLVTIICKGSVTISATGSIVANGVAGGAGGYAGTNTYREAGSGGGASGGGCILVVWSGSFSNAGTLQANGGIASSPGTNANQGSANNGMAGGVGSIANYQWNN